MLACSKLYLCFCLGLGFLVCLVLGFLSCLVLVFFFDYGLKYRVFQLPSAPFCPFCSCFRYSVCLCSKHECVCPCFSSRWRVMMNPVDAGNVGILGLWEPSHAGCTRALSVPETAVTAALTFLSHGGRGRMSTIQLHFSLFSLATFMCRDPSVFWK